MRWRTRSSPRFARTPLGQCIDRAARGVRVLGGFDPYVGQPDRAALVPAGSENISPTVKSAMPSRNPDIDEANANDAQPRPTSA